jgi:hypothetical protein
MDSEIQFSKVSVDIETPSEEGKYIVFTKTGMGNQNVLEIAFHIKSGKTHWGCNNQIVTHWLKKI